MKRQFRDLFSGREIPDPAGAVTRRGHHAIGSSCHACDGPGMSRHRQLETAVGCIEDLRDAAFTGDSYVCAAGERRIAYTIVAAA
jgi:hypothetical protein